MSNEEIARCYRVLKRILKQWDAFSLEASDVVELMDALEEELC